MIEQIMNVKDVYFKVINDIIFNILKIIQHLMWLFKNTLLSYNWYAWHSF